VCDFVQGGEEEELEVGSREGLHLPHGAARRRFPEIWGGGRDHRKSDNHGKSQAERRDDIFLLAQKQTATMRTGNDKGDFNGEKAKATGVEKPKNEHPLKRRPARKIRKIRETMKAIKAPGVEEKEMRKRSFLNHPNDNGREESMAYSVHVILTLRRSTGARQGEGRTGQLGDDMWSRSTRCEVRE